MLPLDGKAALVTGAKGGLGSAIADELHAQGARVFGTSRDPVQAERIAEKYGTSPVVMDVADVSSIRMAVKSLWESQGPFHLLCNNAGINAPQAGLDVDEKTWQRVFDTNVTGTFFVTQTLARYWVADGIRGSVVNVGSQAGSVAIEDRVAYGSSKAAIAHMTRVLAFEWGQFGIRVNAVAPTFIRTELSASTLDRPGMEEKLTSRIPMGRLGIPGDVAPSVAFLFNDQASLITGHTLAIDGGYTIH